MEEKTALSETGNFIHTLIKEDLGTETSRIVTRFPPEPSGYLHIGHAKSILLNYGLSHMYGGTFNLRFDDTNPAKEDGEFVDSIIRDVKWLGADFGGTAKFASDYFGFFYEKAVELIKRGLAYVCDLSPDDVRSFRGTLSEPGKESPFRNRSVDENLTLFDQMKNGAFPDGSKTLRAKIDMNSPNINMRDPVIYRIARLTHQHTGDQWIVYPMYDFSHPLQDAYEGVTHSICTLEFEDHRPLYDWVVGQFDFNPRPRQIEFAKLYLTNTVSGKRYIKKLVEDGVVDGWDDPRLITIAGMRRRGYTSNAIRDFCDQIGVSKSNSKVEFSFLEHCVRNDLKSKCHVLMAVLDPLKVIITNYPEDTMELLEIENNPETEMGTRSVPFSRNIYIERSDFAEVPPPKFFRLKPDGEVRLKGAYFIKCVGVERGEDGEITAILCEYDKETKSGSGFNGRKVKGTIHWVDAECAVPVRAMLYDNLVFDDATEEGGVRFNENSLVVADAVAEPLANHVPPGVTVQFMRNGYFCRDIKSDGTVFNRVVSLKSSYK